MDGSTFLTAFGPAEAYFLSFSPSGCFTSSEEGFSSDFSDFSAIFCTAHFCASSFVIPSLSIYPSLLLSSLSSVSMFLPLLNTPEKLLSFFSKYFSPYVTYFLYFPFYLVYTCKFSIIIYQSFCIKFAYITCYFSSCIVYIFSVKVYIS